MRIACVALLASCTSLPRCSQAQGQAPTCVLVSDDRWGPDGTVPIRAEVIASGLEVPWSFAFLPGGDVLVSERVGRVRLLRQGQLAPAPVLTIKTAEVAEGGLLGLAISPRDPTLLFLYATVPGPENQLQRWKLAADHQSATLDKVLVSGIAAAPYHDGGRIRFGPDGMLYVGTGDARDPDRAQDPASPNGKLLRYTPDGAVPADNPLPGNPLWLLGVRNPQGFDWLPDGTLLLSDHGPSGELARRGHDELTFAHKGDNLGWPTVYGCQAHQGFTAPAISFENALPPGGLALYTGNAIPEWTGSVLVASLGATHLHRFVLGAGGAIAAHEVYLREQFGRLRELSMTPSGELWVTTSNCDGRGTCGPAKDQILRVVR